MKSIQHSDSGYLSRLLYFSFKLEYYIHILKYPDIKDTAADIFTYVDSHVATTQMKIRNIFDTLESSLVPLPSHSLPLP